MATSTQTDKAKLDELYKALGEAVTKRDSSAMRKLQSEINKLENAEKTAAEEAQKGVRDTFTKDASAALNGMKLPAGVTLSVTGKRTDTGFDDWSASVGLPNVLELVHTAMAGVKVPSTVNGFTFQDGTVTLTGRRTGGGGGGGAGHLWVKDNELPGVRLGVAFDHHATAAEKAEHKMANTGSKQWAIKVRVVKASGYTQ